LKKYKKQQEEEVNANGIGGQHDFSNHAAGGRPGDLDDFNHGDLSSI